MATKSWTFAGMRKGRAVLERRVRVWDYMRSRRTTETIEERFDLGELRRRHAEFGEAVRRAVLALVAATPPVGAI